MEKNTKLIEGQRPIPNYPISAKLGAFCAGAKHSDRPYLLHLDSDTLLLNDFKPINQNDADVFLKPVDLGFIFWGSEESYERWKYLYSEIGKEFPGITLKSSIDKKPIPPFYNAGVVLAKNNGFASDWLEMTKFVHNEYPDQRFSDQVALGLLSDQLKINRFTEKESWIMGGHYWCPTDVNVLRYQTFEQLARTNNPYIWKKLLDIGITLQKLYKIEDKFLLKLMFRYYRAMKFRQPWVRKKLNSLNIP